MEDNCYICWKRFESGKLVECCPEYLKSYSKYLEGVPVNDDTRLLLCPDCLSSVENLSKISEELEIVQHKLNQNVHFFSLQIVKCRNLIVKDQSRFNQFQLLGIGTHFILPHRHSPPKPDDSYFYNPLPEDVLNVEISQVKPSRPVSSKATLKKISQTTAGKRDLLVLLERLVFDCNGRPIAPKIDSVNGLKVLKLSSRDDHISPAKISSRPGPAFSKRVRKPSRKLIESPTGPKVQPPGSRNPQQDTKDVFLYSDCKDVAVKQHFCHFPGCHKSFAKAKFLKEHFKSHSAVKFQCSWPECGRGFQRGDKLARHYRIHTGEKPYKCTICLESFHRSDYVTRHMKLQHAQLYQHQQINLLLK